MWRFLANDLYTRNSDHSWPPSIWKYSANSNMAPGQQRCTFLGSKYPNSEVRWSCGNWCSILAMSFRCKIAPVGHAVVFRVSTHGCSTIPLIFHDIIITGRLQCNNRKRRGRLLWARRSLGTRTRAYAHSIYRLNGEAKGTTVFRIPEDAYKSRGRSPRDLWRLKVF